VVSLLETPDVSLSSLLMSPLERVGEYHAFAKDLLAATPPNHLDYTDVAKALEELAQVSHSLTRLVARGPNLDLLKFVPFVK